MTPQQLVGLVIRMFSVVLIALCLPYLTTLPALLQSHDMDTSATFSMMIGLAYFVLAIVVWFFPMTIAHKLVPKSSFDNRFNTRPDEVATVAVAILGLWKLIQAGPELISYIFRVSLSVGSNSLFMALSPKGKVDLLVMLLTVVIALVFIFKAHAIGSFIANPKKTENP
jgi:hypothetical protein